MQNGCIPKYNGNDTIFNIKNPDKSDYDNNVANSGCPGWKQNSILNGGAFVTADGMIYFPYSYFAVPIIAVDVNGQKGQNKWGYDIYLNTVELRVQSCCTEKIICNKQKSAFNLRADF